MNTTNVYLEDVTRAARQGIALSIACALLTAVAMLAAGLAPGFVAIASIALFAVGCASGGFGLVARVSLRAPRLPRRPGRDGATRVAPLRVPQPR